MMTAEAEVPQGGAVRTQLVGGHPLWREAVFSQQLAQELDGRAAVSPALKQHVEDLAFMVDCAPEIHPLASDPRPPSRRRASDRSAEDGPAAAVAQSSVRISAPNNARHPRSGRT